MDALRGRRAARNKIGERPSPNLPRYHLCTHLSDGDGCNGVFFPDLPGCVSSGEDSSQAAANAQEALAAHIEGMLEDGEEPPVPSLLADPLLAWCPTGEPEAWLMIGASLPMIRARALNGLPAVHPGEFIRENLLRDDGISALQMARELGVPQSDVDALLEEKAEVSAPMALMLAKYFGQSPEFWLNLQRNFDLKIARADRHLRRQIESIPPVANRG